MFPPPLVTMKHRLFQCVNSICGFIKQKYLSNARKLEFPCDYSIWRTEKPVTLLESIFAAHWQEKISNKGRFGFAATFSFTNQLS
jgi:hypothetical protein